MNNILETIVAHKKQEVARVMSEIEVSTLVKSPGFQREPISLKKSLLDPIGSGIIAFGTKLIGIKAIYRIIKYDE